MLCLIIPTGVAVKRTSTILLALGAAALLLIGLLTLVHARRILAANHAASSYSLAAHAKSAQVNADDSNDSGVPSVIRFARNPERMPPFLVNDLDGGIISTAGLHGKVVLINFWATWCPPCREEIPELLQLKKEFQGRMEIVGISEDEDPPEAVLKFARQKGMNYPIVMATEQLIDAYGGVPALPTSFLIDTQGRVVQKHSGFYPIEWYRREINSLLGRPTDARVETFIDMGQVFLRNAANAT